MRILAHRSSLVFILTILMIAAILAGNVITETGEAQPMPSPFPKLLPADQLADQPTIQHADPPVIQDTDLPLIQPTPTLFTLGPLIDPDLDLWAGPVDVPLELRIPSLDVDVAVVGVGLVSGNEMDAPKGPVGDPLWYTAYWYRGGGIPGEVGTATIAGHVNDPLGLPDIFTHLNKLRSGDLIIIHYTKLDVDIRFIVDEIRTYTLLESYYPGVLKRIFGAGPVTGAGPQPAPDGLSHLTLITCAGDMVNNQFDHRTVIYATRSE